MTQAYGIVRRDKHLIYLHRELAGDDIAKNVDDIIRAVVGAPTPERSTLGRGGRMSVVWTRVAGRHVVMRRFTHGGLLARLLPELTLGKGRILYEIDIVETALQSHVPTPRILAAVFEKRALLFHRCHVMTEEVSGASNLTEFFLQLPALDAPFAARRKRAAIEATARTIGWMHHAGIQHADLHLRNILVRLPGVEHKRDLLDRTTAYIVDFDESKRVAGMSLRRRMGNLRRLARSVMKVHPVRENFSLRDAIRFLRVYLGTRDRGHIMHWLRELSRPPRWHMLWWKLTGAGKPKRRSPHADLLASEYPGESP